ncbi:hypothetical protein ACVWXQ_007535 [Bradyrhizobium sp. S3.14.4]
MPFRSAIAVSLLGLFGWTGAACAANSCANVDAFSSYDESGLRESDFGIYAVGTFRIAEEQDEAKQPNFNLTKVNCENMFDEMGKRTGLECKMTQATLWANSAKPDGDKPNCSLDVDNSEFSMKELQKGVLIGMQSDSSACFNTMLTIDRNTQRVYLSFTKTKGADKYDQIMKGTCGSLPRTEVLMNCTAWPKMRKQGQPLPSRYCDFSSSKDK